MISASNSFKEKIANGEIPKYRIRLLTAAGVSSWIENDKLWADGISFSDGVSSSGSFDIGSAIIGSFNFILNNFDGTFDDTDFKGAIVYPYAYFEEDGVMDSIQKGTFYVATHKTTGYIIRCTALDGLKLLDQSDTYIQYPVTVESLIRQVATQNGITVANTSIPGGSKVIADAPEDTMTDRQKVSYACQISGNFARMTSDGKLYIGWYDTQNPVVINTTFDGKDLWTNPIAITGLSAKITPNADNTPVKMMKVPSSTANLTIIDTAITKAQITISNGSITVVPSSLSTYYTIIGGYLYRTGEAISAEMEVLYGTDTNVLYIEDNPYVTVEDIGDIANAVGARVTGVTIRPGSLPILSDPCIEAGDVLQITDRVTQDVYLFPVTNYSYNRALTQKVTCDFTDIEYDDIRPSIEYDLKRIAQQAVDKFYTWVAYADDASGTNISLSNTGKTYIGIAVNQTVETPDISDPTIYTWKKYVGTGVSSIVYYYKKQNSATPVPSDPSVSPTGWVTTEPTYVPGSTDYLFTCSKITYSDGTIDYTDVQLSSSYSAARDAAAEAANALQTADGKNSVYYQGTQPTGGTYKKGDTWFDTAHGNLIYEYDGSDWTTSHLFGREAIQDLAINNAKIANLDAGKIQTGELTTILIRSNNNDYWNLGQNDITKTIEGQTYTFKGNTLQTHHLVAEEDIYVDGGPGSFLNIAMKSDTRESNFQVSNTGVLINDQIQTQISGTNISKYVSLPVREDVVLHGGMTYEYADDTSSSLNVYLRCDSITFNEDRGGYFFAGVNGLVGYGESMSGFEYRFDRTDNRISLGVYHTDPSYVADTQKTRIFFNDNEITPISEAYPIASGHHGAPAVRVESGMATYMSIGVNATSKTLYVYGSDNKGSLNYIGRVALV